MNGGSNPIVSNVGNSNTQPTSSSALSEKTEDKQDGGKKKSGNSLLDFGNFLIKKVGL